LVLTYAYTQPKHLFREKTEMKNANTIWLLAGLLALSGVAQAACNANMPITRPDSRYEAVAGATPVGSEVRDKATGLVWQRCVVGKVWNGTTCNGTASYLTWQQALDTVRTATASTAATGASATWRLPNHAELYSLAERACNTPAINTTWFPATPLYSMWSSSPYLNDSDLVWLMDFTYGNGSRNIKTSVNRARLVRSSL
jgi:hypothetical protein